MKSPEAASAAIMNLLGLSVPAPLLPLSPEVERELVEVAEELDSSIQSCSEGRAEQVGVVASDLGWVPRTRARLELTRGRLFLVLQRRSYGGKRVNYWELDVRERGQRGRSLFCRRGPQQLSAAKTWALCVAARLDPSATEAPP